MDGDLYDSGVEVIGRLCLDNLEPRLHYVFRPGEPEAEVRYSDRHDDEQAKIFLDARQQSAIPMDEKASRYVRLEHGRPRRGVAVSWCIPAQRASCGRSSKAT